MHAKSFDWKDVANAQFEKALALAIVLVLFAIMISPKMEVENPVVKYDDLKVIILPPDIKDKIEQPPVTIIGPDIATSDLTTDTEAERELIEAAINSLGRDLDDPIPPSTIKVDALPIFVPFEDEP